MISLLVEYIKQRQKENPGKIRREVKEGRIKKVLNPKKCALVPGHAMMPNIP